MICELVPPMSETGQKDVTVLLSAIADGDSRASSDLLPIVYEQLRRLARSQMAREKPGMTLQPTALVHEAYMRLVGDADVKWNSRGHFFGAAAQAMRRILVENARSRHQIKRGGNRERIELTESSAGADPAAADPAHQAAAGAEVDGVDQVALDEALKTLESIDERKVRVVMLRYYAGLSVEETAAALDVSPATVKNDWAYAKAWLFNHIKNQTLSTPPPGSACGPSGSAAEPSGGT
jgi:RNA polymerase sigma factor (TIGR02999 family)